MEKLEEWKVFLLEHKIYLLGGVFFLLGIVGVCFLLRKNVSSQSEPLLVEEPKEEIQSPKPQECFFSVDVKGEVKNPGLYQLDCDSRVQDAILLAGGITEKADTSVLNLSKKIQDEMVIIIYSKEEVNHFTETKKVEEQKEESCQKQEEVKNDACVEKENKVETSVGEPTSSPSPTVTSPTKQEEEQSQMVSLNQATLEQLMTLSGIGESKAKSILEYRNQNGGFHSIEEVKNVKGIGDKIFEKIKPYLTL